MVGPQFSEALANYRGIPNRSRRTIRRNPRLFDHVMRAYLAPEDHQRLTIILPYTSGFETTRLVVRNKVRKLLRRDWPTVFFTSENVAPRWDLAPHQIGFFPDMDNARYLRFPNWMLHLDWEQLPTQPEHVRYGTRLNVDRLMTPLKNMKSVGSRKRKAVMFTSHFKGQRAALFEVTSKILGCDGFGRVFGQDTRRRGGKFDLTREYEFALCPENSIGPGYITEKIPEAYYAGCVPITWCRPEDLAIDFNPKAVVNLYGKTNAQQESLLKRLKEDSDFVRDLRSEPLLLRRPTLAPLIRFLQDAVRCE